MQCWLSDIRGDVSGARILCEFAVGEQAGEAIEEFAAKHSCCRGTPEANHARSGGGTAADMKVLLDMNLSPRWVRFLDLDFYALLAATPAAGPQRGPG